MVRGIKWKAGSWKEAMKIGSGRNKSKFHPHLVFQVTEEAIQGIACPFIMHTSNRKLEKRLIGDTLKKMHMLINSNHHESIAYL